MAFDETYNFYIRCYKNSYAHRYAINNEIPVRFIGTSVISVDINDISLQYRSSTNISPLIDADEGASYTVTYTSSNPSVATVDSNGVVTSVKQSGLNRGSTVITVTVTDSYGNTETDTCTVTVQFAWWQWIIKIVLFGWGWY